MCASRTTQAAWDSWQNFIKKKKLFFFFLEKGSFVGRTLAHTCPVFFSMFYFAPSLLQKIFLCIIYTWKLLSEWNHGKYRDELKALS